MMSFCQFGEIQRIVCGKKAAVILKDLKDGTIFILVHELFGGVQKYSLGIQSPSENGNGT